MIIKIEDLFKLPASTLKCVLHYNMKIIPCKYIVEILITGIILPGGCNMEGCISAYSVLFSDLN